MLSATLAKNRTLKSQMQKKDGDLLVLGALVQNCYGPNPKPGSSANDQNGQFQKKSFERLLSYFKGSSSKSPGQLFSEPGRIDSASPMLPPVQSFNSITPNKNRNRKGRVEVIQKFHTEPDREIENEEVIAGGIQMEKIISELFTVTGAAYSWKSLDSDLAKSMHQKKEEYWNEVIAESII